MRYFKIVLTFIVTLILFLIATYVHAQADITAGLNYLRTTQAVSGNWKQTSSSLNGVIPTTSTTLETLRLLEDPASPNQDDAILYLVSQTIEVSDFLSRLIVSLTGTGEDTSVALATVLAARNSDDGWGGTNGYTSNLLDTALILMALKTTGLMDVTILG